jgi:serine/threonine protein kinase
MRKFRDEIAVHQRLYHPNIVLLMGACVQGNQLMIVQELMYRDLERVLFDESIKVSLSPFFLFWLCSELSFFCF